MARRMEIELTSLKDDVSYTWRAAGARQPKGVVETKLLPAGAKVGDVLRVEADFELDGITVVQVLPNKEHSPSTDRIELRPERPVTGGVTTTLVGKEERRGSGRRDALGEDRPRRDRPSRDSRPGRPPAERGDPRPRPTAERGDSRSRPARPEGAPPREPREPREGGARPDGARRPARARPVRLVPGRVHLDALLDTLAPERRPIAEQLALGGLPKVRRAIADEQAAAQREGRPAAAGDAIVAIAEELLKPVREAAWRDRAEAAAKSLEQISLRDLRAAVVGAAPQNDEGRTLLRSLREALETRVTKLRTTWEEEIAHALEEGRVLQALRLSARLPEPSARFPAALVTRLAEAAGAALGSDVPPERWVAVLEAAVASPIRRSIHPAGLPEDPSGAVRQAATVAAGRIPALAKLVGLAMPPPPRPVGAIPRPPRPAVAGAHRLRVPPPPAAVPRPPAEGSAAEPTPPVAAREGAGQPSEDAPGAVASPHPSGAAAASEEAVTVPEGASRVPPATPAAPAEEAAVEATGAVHGVLKAAESPVDGPPSTEDAAGEHAVAEEPVEQAAAEIESPEPA
ncbi:MAG TPA: hypothetical protein VNF07_09730 [Acidimicrobiales bacterium]|nr:hypothetical protein [Acidimicrobiales bacterium]